MREISGKVAVITGAAGGVGAALAAGLAKRGCALALVDINQQALDKLHGELAASGVKVTAHRVDITDREQMAALAGDVLTQHGKVNILVNNAGITYQKSFATHTLEDWDRIVGINWWGVLYGCHFFLPALKEAGEGHIINMSSMSGSVGLPNQTSYCATKGAVKLLSESLWGELVQHNIGVTSVHPGAIKTDMIQATLQNSDDVEAAQRNYEMAQRIGVTAEHVADRIIRAIEKNQLRIRIGKDSIMLDILKRLFPLSIQRLLKRVA